MTDAIDRVGVIGAGSMGYGIANGPPIALKLDKQVVHEGEDAPLDTGLEYEKKAFALLMGTDDMVKGVQAFHEDGEPALRGA